MAEQQNDTKPFGRPLKFETVEQLDRAIDAYLGECAPHVVKVLVKKQKADGGHYWAEDEEMSDQRPITITGAAMALGTIRRTLLGYKERPDFLPSIERLLSACERYAEEQLFNGSAANGAKFNLTNNYGWVDKQAIDHGGEIGLFGTDTLKIRTVDGRNIPQPETTDSV